MDYLFWNAKRSLVVCAVAMVLFGCSDGTGEVPNEFDEDQKVTRVELKSLIDMENVLNIADALVSELYELDRSGSTGKTGDECYVAEYSKTGFTLSFEECTIQEGGEIVNGTLGVVYGGDGDHYAFAITYNELEVGNVSINGTRSFKINSSEESQSISWTVDSKMEVILADGSLVTEKGVKTIGFVFGEELNDGAMTLDGEWILKSEGNTYIVDISHVLEAKFGCEYFGKGMMALSKNGLEVSVDFGDGTCDDLAILVYPDKTEEEISLKD